MRLRRGSGFRMSGSQRKRGNGPEHEAYSACETSASPPMVVLFLVVCAAMLASPVLLSRGAILAQQPQPPPIEGVVVGGDGRPVGHARIAVVGTYWTTATDADGRFRLRVPEGTWSLRVHHVGFEARTVPVEVPREEEGPLRVTLARAPVELKGLSVEAPADGALGRTVTKETIRQAPALGEPDVFRAVALLPEASQPNDLTGRIHLAGGPSDETGVRLDGHPLIEPFHLLGLQGAFNVAALERAEVSTAYLGAPARDRLSGVIELETRRERDEAETEGVLSLLSTSVTTTRPDLPGGVDVLASGRMTYADRVISLLDLDAPRIGYHDLLLRVGRSWGDGWRVEGLGYSTQTRFREGEVRDLRIDDPLSSGERLLGVRVRRSTGAWRIRARGGWNHAAVDFDEGPRGPDFVDHDMNWLSAAAEVERRWRSGRVAVGVSVDHRRHDLEARNPSRIWDVSMPERVATAGEATATGLFAAASKDLGAGLAVEFGGRLLRLGGEHHLAPRARLDARLSDALVLTGAVSRRYQYDAHLTDPPEGTVTPPRFLLETPRRADVAALAADWTPGRLLGARPSVRLTAFWKRYGNQTRFVAPDSVAGSPGPFPVFQRVPGRSYGASASVKVPFADEGLVQASYTFERAREIVDGETFNRDFDLPHRLTLFASAPLLDGWSLNAAFRFRSGPVITPVESVLLVPSPVSPGGTPVRTLDFGRRNSGRLAPYTRLDVGARHRFAWLGGQWVFFAQVLNATVSTNPREADLGPLLAPRLPPDPDERSLPLVPSFGLEVSW